MIYGYISQTQTHIHTQEFVIKCLNNPKKEETLISILGKHVEKESTHQLKYLLNSVGFVSWEKFVTYSFSQSFEVKGT